jgi:putative MATE family efflux protein
VDVDDDPEGTPPLPSAALAAGAAPVLAPELHPPREGYAEIWGLAWPVMLSQLLANAVSLIDVAMVGRLGPDAVAAVGYAGQFFSLIQSLLFAVSAACVALVARAIGAGDADRARRSLAAAIATAVAIALGMAALVGAGPRTLLAALGAEPAVAERAVPYLLLLLGSSLLLAPSLMLESALRADRDTRTPMRIALVVTAVKLGGNALLIFGAFGFPRLELVGAGLATLAAQGVGVAIFASTCARAPRGAPLALRAGDLRRSRALLSSVVRLAVPGIGERLAMQLALLAYFRVLADYGTEAVAAYTVGVRILAFSWLPGTGLGVAASTLVGQALGSGDARGAARTGWRAFRLALLVAVALGALGAAGRGSLARLFVGDAATAAILEPFLLCLAVSQPFLQAHFALGGAHRGAGDTTTPFLAATAGNWALRIPLALILAYGLDADVAWVWWPLVFDHLTRSAWLAWSFRRGRWRHASVSLDALAPSRPGSGARDDGSPAA